MVRVTYSMDSWTSYRIYGETTWSGWKLMGWDAGCIGCRITAFALTNSTEVGRLAYRVRNTAGTVGGWKSYGVTAGVPGSSLGVEAIQMWYEYP
jgi:hypothetical protein